MSEGGSTPTVSGHDEVGDGSVDLARWVALATAALVTEGVAGPGELTLVFTDELSMAALNQDHLGGEGPTDVLAFPIDADAEPEHDEGGGLIPRLLGDVVVCPAVAARQATERNIPVEDEIALLVVHGVLHVLGHDHAEPDETARMRDREQALLAALHHENQRA